jgi:hypothetical protein
VIEEAPQYATTGFRPPQQAQAGWRWKPLHVHCKTMRVELGTMGEKTSKQRKHRALGKGMRDELDARITWCRAVLDGIQALGGEAASHAQLMREPLEAAYLADDLRGMRACCRDLQEWVRYMPAPERWVVEQAVAQQSSGAVEAFDVSRKRETLERVRRRGSIANEMEHRVVLERVEEIHSDPSHTEEVRLLNDLLVKRER